MAIRGPEHAKEAERLLEKAGHEKNAGDKANLLAEAQVHATLALVAVTVHSGAEEKIRRWTPYGIKD